MARLMDDTSRKLEYNHMLREIVYFNLRPCLPRADQLSRYKGTTHHELGTPRGATSDYLYSTTVTVGP